MEAEVPATEKAQRLRVRFARGPEAASVGHLDMTRIWERALRAAGVAVSYAKAGGKQPRITLAAGLPVGVTSDAELLDAVLARRTDPARLVGAVSPHLPPGIRALDAREVGLRLPSLPASVRWAEYEVDVPGVDIDDARRAVEAFLDAATFPWRDTRGEKVREYDFRPLVQRVDVSAGEGVARLTMLLRLEQGAVGRPEQLAKALGLPEPARIHRARLVVAEASPAREAWRRVGRYR